MRTFVIAEAASAHDGDLSKALRLIDAAALAGADAVKFQFWSDADVLADRRRVEPAYREIYRRYQMPADWLSRLSLYCVPKGLEFMATCYLPQDVAIVAPYVQRFKIASFEATDRAFRAAHASFRKPLIVSLGMVDGTASWSFVGSGQRPNETRFLHCVSAYPAPLNEMNLRVIQRYGLDGLSDHSRHVATGAVAVACGARIVEVHVRAEDTDPSNPDHAVSLLPGELRQYVEHIRVAEQLLSGHGCKALMPSEAAMAKYRVT